MSTTSPLAQFSTCELSDALVKLNVPAGGHIPDVHMISPTTAGGSDVRICGPAYTVQMVPASDVTSPKPAAHFVDTVTADSVVVIDAPSGPVAHPTLRPFNIRSPPSNRTESKSAVWGGLMTAGAQVRGAIGVVISGRCRDVGEHRSAGFPVFARGQSTLGQSPFTRPSAVNTPVTIQPQGLGSDTFPAVTVHPGDWIIADEDGVVCVPKDLEAKVAELARKGREVDARCMADIQAGLGVQNSFKTHRGK